MDPRISDIKKSKPFLKRKMDNLSLSRTRENQICLHK